LDALFLVIRNLQLLGKFTVPKDISRLPGNNLCIDHNATDPYHLLASTPLDNTDTSCETIGTITTFSFQRQNITTGNFWESNQIGRIGPILPISLTGENDLVKISTISTVNIGIL